MTKTNKKSAKTSAADPRDGHRMEVTFEQEDGGTETLRLGVPRCGVDVREAEALQVFVTEALAALEQTLRAGEGVLGRVDGHEVALGNASLRGSVGVDVAAQEDALHAKGRTVT